MSVVTRTMALVAKRSDNFFSVTNISPKLAPEKLVNTLDSKQKAFPTTHARLSRWRSVLCERYYVLAQNVYHDVHVSWKDYTRGSDGKLTLVTLCSGADHADVIRQTSVQVFRRFNQDWSKQQTRKLITFHLYNPEMASPSVLIQGHDTMKWAQEESDRVRCLVHHLDARWADSATCLSECRDLPLVLPDFHGYIYQSRNARTPHQEVGNPLREGGLPAVTACSWVASPSTGVDRGCCHIQQRGSGGPHQHLDCNHHRLCFSSRHPSLGCSSDCPHCGNNHLSNAI